MKIKIKIWNKNTCTSDWRTCKFCKRCFSIEDNYVNIYSCCTKCGFISKFFGNDICPYANIGSFPRCETDYRAT